LAAHFIGPEAAVGFFHTFSGWLVFIMAFIMLFLLHRLLILWMPEPKRAAEDVQPHKVDGIVIRKKLTDE